MVVAGRSHSYIQANDKFIAFGLDHKGRMGLGEYEDSLLSPIVVSLFDVRIIIP